MDFLKTWYVHWYNYQIWTELTARDMPIFLFPDDNLSRCQGILTKLGICIDIKEILFQIADGQISWIFDRSCDMIMARYYRFMFLFSS